MKQLILTHIKTVTAVYLTVLFVLIPLAIKFSILPQNPTTNFIALLVCTIVCILIMWIEGWTLNDFDLEFSIAKCIAYLFFTIIGILFLFFIKDWFKFKLDIEMVTSKEFLYPWIPLCVLQVLSYRVFLFKKLQLFTKCKIKLILINAALFTMMHIMFSQEFIFISMIGGLGFGCMYVYYPNSILMSLSHIILNFFATLIGALHYLLIYFK